MNNKFFNFQNELETHSIELERIGNLVSILLQEHFDSKSKYENEHGVTYWVSYDNNFQTLTTVILNLLSEQQKKSNELFEQFCKLKDELTVPSNNNSIIST